MYYIEITDTFGGEANYSWVRRYRVEAKSMRGAITKLARNYGGNWRKAWDSGDYVRYNLANAAICAFVSYADEFTPECQTI